MKIVKILLGLLLIFSGCKAFFSLFPSPSTAESIGFALGALIIIIPGILLIRNAVKND